ncbi:MAG: S1 RNA-binding domain-containing protein, partial [Gammaproteobacteria bacterium]
LSDLSWSVSGEEAVRNYKKGEAMEAVVLSVDAERERIALGVKQLEEDPLSQYLGEHPKGSSVKGKAQKVDVKSVVVSLTDRVEGYIRVSELSRAPADDARKLVKIGDEVEAMLIGVDRKKRILTLSVKAKEAEDEEKAIKEYSADSEGAGGTKLGEILKHQLNNQEG